MASPNIETVSGRVFYDSPISATLMEDNGSVSLLVIDKPPMGSINSEDIAAAASFLRNFMGKQEGDPILIHGIRISLARPAMLIIRVD